MGMKDTTFFPSDEQLQRLAKSYRHGGDTSGLTELPIEQLTYPLDAPNRFPSPAGGLFSTATDVIALLPDVAQRRNVSRQTLSFGSGRAADELHADRRNPQPSASRKWLWVRLLHQQESHGETLPGSGGTFGHGGAYSTNMDIDPQHGLVKIFMVQSAGTAGPHGREAFPCSRRPRMRRLRSSASPNRNGSHFTGHWDIVTAIWLSLRVRRARIHEHVL